MRSVLKWVGIAVGGLAALAIAAFAAVMITSASRLNASYDIPAEAVAVPTDEESVERGRHVAVIRGCIDCHRADLGGGAVVEDPAIGEIYASNLTTGAGGVGAAYSDEALERAIRHGVRADGTGLIVMPSQEFFVLSEGDLGALIAYIRSVPPVDREIPERRLTPLARALWLAGQLPPKAADVIDHTTPHPAAPEVAADAAYGEYLAVGCIGCHGADFSGGILNPGSPPDSTPSANLTPAGNLAGWDESSFMQTLRTGVTPEGKVLNPSDMPWPSIGQMTDLELQALWAYLQSLPPAAAAAE